DVTDLVAGIVLAMLGELDAVALVRALVHAGEEPFDDGFGDEAEAAIAGERRRVEGERHGQASRALTGTSRSAGIASSSLPITISVVTPSASALKVVINRCRRTGCATSRTSSVVACSRP